MNGIILLLSIIPHTDVARDEVSMLERNSYYDCECRLVFKQEIFWQWSDASRRFEVVAWRLSKEGMSFSDHPPTLTWIEDGKLRQVRAEYWRETHTQGVDPELSEREITPVNRRRGLSK